MIVVFTIVVSSIGTLAAQAAELDTAPPQSAAEVVKPDPKYSPDEVVRFQIGALAYNDEPYKNAGIEFAFSFASPANRKVTGPLDRFIQLVNNPLYQPMLNHQTAHYGELRVDGDQALQVVILTTASGERVGYVFRLSRQEGDPYDQCWMTDGVLLLREFQEL
jgi:hypothetical protein